VYIQDDDVDYSTVPLDPVFEAVYWPNLHTLELYGMHMTPSTAVRFFSTHGSLTSIRVSEAMQMSNFIKSASYNPHNTGVCQKLSFPDEILPNLKVLDAPSCILYSVLVSATSRRRPIGELRINAENLKPEVLSCLKTLPLFSVYLGASTPKDLELLASAVPGLRKLGSFPSERGDIVRDLFLLFVTNVLTSP
jgi:hypothetical protein